MKLKNRKYRNQGAVICDQCGYEIKYPDFSGRSPTRQQLRCTIKNGRPGQRMIGSYSECQASFHQKRLQKKNNDTQEIEVPRPKIRCEICRKEMKRPAHNQKACSYKNSDRDTKCQQEHHRRNVRAYQARLREEKKKIDSGRPCLKCGKGFKGKGQHNRICEDCERANSHVLYRAHRMHSISIR